MKSKILARGLIIALTVAGLALAALVVVGVIEGVVDFADPRVSTFVVIGLAVVGGLALWWAADKIVQHQRALGRLRGALLSLEADDRASLPALNQGDDDDGELAHLHAGLGRLLERLRDQGATPDRRLEAVLAAIGDAIVVITGAGQVSLVNHGAKVLLGAERVAVGTSVYAALSRTTVRTAVARAVAAGCPVDAMIGTQGQEHQLTAKVSALGDGEGAVLIFPAEEVAFRAEIDSDLALLDLPPPAPAIHDDLPLDQLPVLVFDTETTGLEVESDRIVSIGAVRLAGDQVYRGVTFDRLVNPNRPIPARSTAIHGITDGMVRDAERFPAVYAQFSPHLAGVVAIGHQVAFDLAMLRRECDLAGLEGPAPECLDTCQLAAVLEPSLPGLGLETVADWLGVSVHGRHTALGDSLVTAEVYARMVPRLADRGVTTFGQAKAFAAQAKTLVQEQKKAGW